MSHANQQEEEQYLNDASVLILLMSLTAKETVLLIEYTVFKEINFTLEKHVF